MIKVAIILGTTRPQRNGEQVGNWFHKIAQQRQDIEVEYIDLRDVNLPFLDEAMPPSMGQYGHDHTKQWAQRIAGFDGFVFVTPEYNHGTSAVLKNALDFIYAEWNNKAVGFVSYGSAGGARAVEQLRLIVAELQMASIRNQVMLNLFTDFENMSKFTPAAFQEQAARNLLEQLVSWSKAMKTVREKS